MLLHVACTTLRYPDMLPFLVCASVLHSLQAVDTSCHCVNFQDAMPVIFLMFQAVS